MTPLPSDASDNSDHNDHSDLAALDFGPDRGTGAETGLAQYLGDYALPSATHEPDLRTGLEPFAVANPAGTVTVTTLMDGRVDRVELSPAAISMTEAVLAEEIVVIAGLATQTARSAQYTYMLDGMREQGHDNAGTRDFLTRDLDLPTPEQASAARAEVFATRYAGDE